MSDYDKTKELPIYKKAELLFQLVESLVASLPEDDDFIQSTKEFMRAGVKNPRKKPGTSPDCLNGPSWHLWVLCWDCSAG